jgi:muramoyltetrapeptide carboxypeptidase
MKMTLPPPLRSGDTIGVMAPSSRISRADVEAAAALLQNKGYKLFIHPQTLRHADDAPWTQYAGTSEEKVAALHDLAADPDIKAVFFAAGGQRALTMLDRIDYGLIAANPKIYMGFSDCTALLNAIAKKSGLATWHGPTFRKFLVNPQAELNLRLLEGQERTVPFSGAAVFRPGKAEGVLFGGNLAGIRSLLNDDLPLTDGGILFLEEHGEELTTVDRDFCALKRRGILDKLGGLVLGQFSDLRDTGTPFGLTFEDVIAEHTKGLRIPIVMNAPFGHMEDLYALPIGLRVYLSAAFPPEIRLV